MTLMTYILFHLMYSSSVITLQTMLCNYGLRIMFRVYYKIIFMIKLFPLTDKIF